MNKQKILKGVLSVFTGAIVLNVIAKASMYRQLKKQNEKLWDELEEANEQLIYANVVMTCNEHKIKCLEKELESKQQSKKKGS